MNGRSQRVSGASACYATPGYVEVTYGEPREWFVGATASF
jgi:hypothetical protein